MTGGNPRRQSSLIEMLEATVASSGELGCSEDSVPTMKDDEITRTCFRIPRAVLEEVAASAQSNRMSMSLVINVLLDDYLYGQGRPTYSELAPRYPDYVLRKKA